MRRRIMILVGISLHNLHAIREKKLGIILRASCFIVGYISLRIEINLVIASEEEDILFVYLFICEQKAPLISLVF